MEVKLKDFDETLYPVDHGLAGQIRDFSLFNHFVKPMPAGVTVTCVMDCCHSGSVLYWIYHTYQATSVGTIRQSMDALTNLAFLYSYILAGGMLPGGRLLDGVAHNVEEMTGTPIENLVGTGEEEMTFDTEAFADQTLARLGSFSAVDCAQWEGLYLQEADDVRRDAFDDENDVWGETLLSGAAGGRDVGSGADDSGAD